MSILSSSITSHLEIYIQGSWEEEIIPTVQFFLFEAYEWTLIGTSSCGKNSLTKQAVFPTPFPFLYLFHDKQRCRISIGYNKHSEWKSVGQVEFHMGALMGNEQNKLTLLLGLPGK